MHKPLYGESLRMVEAQAGKLLENPASIMALKIRPSRTLANLAAEYFNTLDPDTKAAAAEELFELLEAAAQKRARKLCGDAALQALNTVGVVREVA